jgi:putative membrane protein
VNISRGLARQLAAAPAEQRRAYAELLADFPPALATHLRRPRGSDGVHVPGALLDRLHAAVRDDAERGALGTDARLVTAPLLQAYDDVVGGCERIRNTPIPFSYSSYVKQFVMLYAIIMPFGLVNEFGYGTVIASMFTFFATMGLELLAGEIEEPFGSDRNDLPLEDIGAVIQRDVRAILTPA